MRRALTIGRDLVRDVLTHVVDNPALEHVYPTVAAAVDAAGGGGHDGPVDGASSRLTSDEFAAVARSRP